MAMRNWYWSPDQKEWVEVPSPEWLDFLEYTEAEEKPTSPPPKRATVNGITFEVPDPKAVNDGELYYIPNLRYPLNPYTGIWPATIHEETAGLIHKNRQAAVKHALALLAFNKATLDALKD